MSLLLLIELLFAEFLCEFWAIDPEQVDLFNLLKGFSAGRRSTLLLFV